LEYKDSSYIYIYIYIPEFKVKIVLSAENLWRSIKGRKFNMSGIKTFKKCKSATFTLDGTSYKIGKFFFHYNNHGQSQYFIVI
jgi:hypothetical protein